VLGSVLLMMGGLSAMFALIADLVAFNRQIAELTLERVRRMENRLGLPQQRFPEAELRRELETLRQRTEAAKTA